MNDICGIERLFWHALSGRGFAPGSKPMAMPSATMVTAFQAEGLAPVLGPCVCILTRLINRRSVMPEWIPA